MEGINSSIETEENISWEQLKTQSSAEAEKMIGSILDYEAMSFAEKSSALHFLLHELIEDNANRFVAEAVSIKLSRLEENERHRTRTAELDEAV
ncbi:MAG: hypothetical protein SGJ18_16175 [Pseudomonadota bacterium]|nr:hypothetical protein [Pseudomonadota bacterium]